MSASFSSRVLAHRLEQPVAAGRPASSVDQRLLDQCGRAGRARRFARSRRPAATASAASSVQPPANTESRASTQRSRRRRAGRSSSRSARAASAGAAARCGSPPVSSAEAIVSRSAICSTGQRAHARRGELERERDAVEAPADVGDRARRSAAVTAKAGCAAAARSTNSRTASYCASASSVAGRARGSGTRERRHRDTSLSPATCSGSRLDARTLQRRRPACEQSPSRARRRPATRCSQLSRISSSSRSRDVLDQRLDAPGGPASSLTPSTDATACGTSRGVGQRRELDEPHAVGKVVQHVGADLQRQPRLAEAAHAEQRQQPRRSRAALAPRPARARGRRTTSPAAAGCSASPRASAAPGSPARSRGMQRPGRRARDSRGRAAARAPRSRSVTPRRQPLARRARRPPATAASGRRARRS